ncbi:MAG: membrane protein insertase YidC [Treponema sp.]|jgi:YidC/Oxa1 family membrane protein insertase|nr:membrane protein insertase YidC [Treponema sp.]
MEKRTLLAVVLSVVVISVYYVIQGVFFPPPQRAPQPTTISAPVTPGPVQPAGGENAVSDTIATSGAVVVSDTAIDGAVSDTAELVEQRVSIETDLLIVTLSSAGGDLLSYKLKQHNDKGDYVDMVLSGNTPAHAFTVSFGDTSVRPITSVFQMRRVSEYVVEFYRDFVLADGSSFRLTKRYEFRNAEYMFELTINLAPPPGSTAMPALNFNGAAYTLTFGPQIGPRFEKLDQRNDYRNYITFASGKQKQEKVTDNPATISTRPTWAAIAGKYFTFIAIPFISSAQYDIAFSSKAEEGLPAASRFYLIRPTQNGRIEDMYRFYLGPKNQESLAVYNNGVNSFGMQNTELIKVVSPSGFGGILSPLETALKWFLMIFYRVIPNYGVAIILLTLLVKILFFPLTKKSSESTLRMQVLSPRIKEIQEKYKDNPQKMNMEMAAFYKAEGYNPLSGCLPMLLQIPIFFAMSNLFNNHFDLRGALFIPVWIPDLSMPESIFNFSPMRLPILGWSDIRLLPIIYVGSQLLYGTITQTPDQQGNAQMKMMMYAMPVIFFFVLYDVPSGMLVYWIVSNLLSLVQQVMMNKYLAPRRAALKSAQNAAASALKIVPPKKKKKR